MIPSIGADCQEVRRENRPLYAAGERIDPPATNYQLRNSRIESNEAPGHTICSN
jgi:hypothetical protein